MKSGEVVVFGCLRAGFAGGMSLYDESEIYNPPLAKKHDPGSLNSVNRECTTQSLDQPASQPAPNSLHAPSLPPTINHQKPSSQIPSISIQPLS